MKKQLNLQQLCTSSRKVFNHVFTSGLASMSTPAEKPTAGHLLLDSSEEKLIGEFLLSEFWHKKNQFEALDSIGNKPQEKKATKKPDTSVGTYAACFLLKLKRDNSGLKEALDDLNYRLNDEMVVCMDRIRHSSCIRYKLLKMLNDRNRKYNQVASLVKELSGVVIEKDGYLKYSQDLIKSLKRQK
jgi:hypothetical protein